MKYSPALPAHCTACNSASHEWTFATRHVVQKSLLAIVCAAACFATLNAQAQMYGTPGEDPIVITRRLSAPSGPAMASPRSTPMSPPPITPAWLEAKVARLEAKAWAFDAGKLITDKNILAAASSDGLRKVCIQDIGSSITTATSADRGSSLLPNNEPQIVVLKGDVVNICR